ncbi:MAG: gamma-glutamyltransferase family protein, partial [Chloroflexota bacterium]|nr:gamma-glutamyltransferase family protein [Chloroflexota bacterium]
ALATSHPPNSSGVIALVALSILERFPPPKGEFDADWIHTAIEASRLALEDRERELAEPEAMAWDAVDRLLGASHARQLAAAIDPRRSGIGRMSTIPRGGGTVFLAAADRWGGLVSLIQSNWHGFGSGVVDPETGIAYQDRGVSFSLDPKHPNALGPGKRTAHTLTPGMLFREGRPWVAHGSMGGEVQPQIYAQVVSALVDRGADVASAVSGPRWGLQTRSILEPPEHLLLESRFPEALVANLAARGHPIQLLEPFDSAVGHCHAIEVRRRDDGSIEGFAAATDPRSEGKPAVF